MLDEVVLLKFFQQKKKELFQTDSMELELHFKTKTRQGFNKN